MGGREVSRPYRVWFFAERLFFMFFVSVPPSIYPLNTKNADAIALAFVGYFCALLCRVFI